MNILVLSYPECLQKLLAMDLDDYSIVSIREGNINYQTFNKYVRSKEIECLQLFFHGVVHVNPRQDLRLLGSLSGYKLFSESDVSRILQWVRNRQRIAVHCLEGNIRASSIALLIAHHQTGDINQALTVLDRSRHHYPSPHIVRVYSEVYKCPELLDAVINWLESK